MNSKELLSAVLNKKVKEVHEGSYKNEINYTIATGEYYCINIHELAHKCKEWAYEQEFILHIKRTGEIEYKLTVESLNINKVYFLQQIFYSKTELQAIFEACEWILKCKCKNN